MLAVALAALTLAGPAQVAFVADGGLYTMGADGSGRALLRAGDLTEPAWSPDGARLAYVSSRGEETAQLMIDGAAVTPLRAGVIDSSPAWSPDGGSLAFSRDLVRGDDIQSQIVVRSLATGQERVLADVRLDVRLTSVGTPAWSPDAATIAYTQTRLDRHADFKPAIRVMPAAGGASRQLIADATEPAYSPDGRRIAFSGVRDHLGQRCGSDECDWAGELYTAAADGSDLRRLTHGEGDEILPVWAPDGSRILFTSDRNLPDSDSNEIYSIAPDGSCLTWLTNGPGSAVPTWRPGSGDRFDPGSCDPDTRRPEIVTPKLPALRGGLWLGRQYRGLALSDVLQGHDLVYGDCTRFRGCTETVDLIEEPACRKLTYRGLLENAYRYVRRRGAVIAYAGRAAVVRVFTRDVAVSLQFGAGSSLRKALRAVDALRAFNGATRLGPPRVPRGMKLPGAFRDARPC